MNIFLTAFFLIVSVVRVEAAVHSLCSARLTSPDKKAECIYPTHSSFKARVLRDIAMWWNQLGNPKDFSITFNNVSSKHLSSKHSSRVSFEELAAYVRSMPDVLSPAEETTDTGLAFGDPAKPGFVMTVNEPNSISTHLSPFVGALVIALFWCCRRGRRLHVA